MKNKVLKATIAAVFLGITNVQSHAGTQPLSRDTAQDVFLASPRKNSSGTSHSFNTAGSLVAPSASRIRAVESTTVPRPATAGNVGYSNGNCGLKYVDVRYSHPADLESACEGIDRASRFFLSYGFNFEAKAIVIAFKDEVRPRNNAADSRGIEAPRVYGFYDRGTGIVEVSSWGTDYLKNRTVFTSLPVTREFHRSIIAHEVAHRFHHLITQSMDAEMGHANSEFIAYIVQIETMQGNERNKVLALWPGARLEAETHVNSMIWGAAPHRFGVMAYRMWKGHSTDLVERMLTGNFLDHDKILWSGL